MSHLQIFLDHLKKHHPVFYGSVAATAEAMPETFQRIGQPMAEWAHTCLGDDFARILAEGYVHLVIEVNQAQMAYEKTGHYPNRSYAEVYEAAYSNKEFMFKYHWGLYAATFGWIHHLKLFDLFDSMFLPKLRQETAAGTGQGMIADFGSGSGIWSRLALRACENWRCVGIDISPTSVQESLLLAERTGFGERSNYVLGDATRYRLEEPADAAISSFLLEHLEQPPALLENIAANLKSGGYGWITAALTAAEIDHINEFRRESEVIRMVEDAGLRVIAALSETPRHAKSKLRFVPRSMAMIVQKRHNDIW